MSDYRIGIVVEGTTDRIVIESALNKILADHTYILTQLQPELSDGLGWSLSMVPANCDSTLSIN